MPNPMISVIIVNYNGKAYLKDCLEYVLASDYDRFEVIVVDNGSKDGSPELIRQIANKANKKIMLLINSTNIGLGSAQNQAVKLASGEILAFLDNDAKPDSNWLKEAVKLFDNPEVGAIQCKLLIDNKDKIIDSLGSYLGKFGFLIHKVPPGKIRDIGQFNKVCEIFSTKGAAMLVRKKVFENIGGFDSDYFLYEEEMDLCWRIWLAGYKVFLAPNSIVYHKWGTTRQVAPEIADKLLYFHGTKNYLSTVFKNGSMKMFFLHMILWIGIAIITFIRKKPKIGLLVISGIIWSLKNFRHLLEKRLFVMSLKRQDLPTHLFKFVSLSYYISTFKKF
jgi:GT2 family glycosyltransferase